MKGKQGLRVIVVHDAYSLQVDNFDYCQCLLGIVAGVASLVAVSVE